MSRYARLFGFSTVAILAATIAGSAHAVTIATVPVGYAGNAPDNAVMIGDNTTGYGSVAYSYRIGTYQVTTAQYAEFLNAKASAADPYGLWNSDMAPTNFEGAISRSGTGPYSYTVSPGYANKPVNYVSWYDAVRFVNWLQNGQGDGDTESGTYKITGGGHNSGNVAVPDATQRASWAATNSFHWLLPSENEWYKAAYYNSATDTYYTFPFQSNLQPAALAPPGNANSGDYFYNSGDPAYNYDGYGSFRTDVGAYPNSQSPFGSFDMGDDVFQWNDTAIGSDRGSRGDDWYGYVYSPAAATVRVYANPTFDYASFGFRVASVGTVPEPSTGVLAVLACGIVWCCKWIARRGVHRNDAGI